MHPESHGIVNNKFYDSVLGINFTIRDTQSDPRWWLAEPVSYIKYAWTDNY